MKKSRKMGSFTAIKLETLVLVMIIGFTLIVCSNGSTDITGGNIITESNNSKITYEIGKPGPAGGIIFYYDPDGFDLFTGNILSDTTSVKKCYYLEAAINDEGIARWGNQSNHKVNTISAAQNDARLEKQKYIGHGLRDTNILAEYMKDLFPPDEVTAAQVCADKEVWVGSIKYDDWFLPSIDELNELYKQKSDFGITDHFWSSTQVFNNHAWGQDFYNGKQDIYPKNGSWKILAIRAF